MNDIRRPKRRPQSPKPAAVVNHPQPVRPIVDKAPVESLPEIEELPQLDESSTVVTPIKRRKRWPIIVGSIVAILLCILAACFIWYQSQLQPVSNDQNATRIRLTIKSGMTPDRIGKQLKESGLIRDELAFTIYTRLTNTQNKLQAGGYNLSPAESLPTIVNHLVAGKVDEFSLTFYPGATLDDPTDTPKAKRTDVTSVLIKAGYSEEEIKAALSKKYDHPLLAGKPEGVSLEGYVYGETYRFATNASVEDILVRTFDEFYAQVEKNKLVEGFKNQGLTFYEGITLASIIQREVHGEEDEAQVAQVFLKRLKEGIVLGSDVTYKYAAKQFGLADSPLQDSPYNTRKVKGLTPTPISSPGLSALLAVTKPAAGDYVYFLAGDDGKTYFAHTEAEHEANIRDHCQIGCSE